MAIEVRYLHDGEWAQIDRLMVYPRDKESSGTPTTWSIGRPDTPGCFRDLHEQTEFQSMRAAIEQAVWLAETPDVLRKLWS